MRRLTELDSTVLGVVARFGPLSPYAVRQHFANSPASRFSSSAGSIYPLLERLEAAQLLESEASARGRQAKREVSITASGRDALRSWLTVVAPRDVFDPPADPLRTRLYFIDELSRNEQAQFFEDALNGLKDRLRANQAYLKGFDADGTGATSRMAARGGIHVTRARIRWLKEARESMIRPSE